MLNAPTTNEVDHITPEERNRLVAFCEHCEEWWRFTVGEDNGLCPKCSAPPSQQIGFQPITQRTFNTQLHGKKKLKKRA